MCMCTCLYACKQVNGTWELKRIVQYFFFPDFKAFFISVNISPLIFLPNKKREQREWSVLFEFRVRRKSNMIFLIIFAKATEGIWAGQSSLNRIALDGIPSCHCCCQACSGGNGCRGSSRLFHFPSHALSYVLK